MASKSNIPRAIRLHAKDLLLRLRTHLEPEDYSDFQRLLRQWREKKVSDAELWDRVLLIFQMDQGNDTLSHAYDVPQIAATPTCPLHYPELFAEVSQLLPLPMTNGNEEEQEEEEELLEEGQRGDCMKEEGESSDRNGNEGKAIRMELADSTLRKRKRSTEQQEGWVRRESGRKQEDVLSHKSQRDESDFGFLGGKAVLAKRRRVYQRGTRTIVKYINLLPDVCVELLLAC